jgi:hypothetical protein
MARSKFLIVFVLALLVGVAYAFWWHSPRNELRRTRDALLRQKTWHVHTVRVFQNIPPETDDRDFFCPGFEHEVARYTDAYGNPAVRESIRLDHSYYNLIEGRWVKANGPTQVLECRQPPLMKGDGIALPFDAVLRDGSFRRGSTRTVGEDSCRDYDIVVPTPTNILERDYRFTLCINERDHLPRQTRRTPLLAVQEDAIDYSGWGALSEPPIPTGIQQSRP